MKVYFNSGNWGPRTREHAGKKLPVNKEFIWIGREWRIPAVYSCAKGLVVDFCIRIPKEQIKAFLRRWNPEFGIGDLSAEEREQLHKDNPFEFDFDIEAKINGKAFREYQAYAINWNPYLPEAAEESVREEEFVDYYGCDRKDGWRLLRASFSWNTVRKPTLKSISFLLKERPKAYPGERFTTEDFNDTREIEFTHPVSKQKHKLVLDQCESKSMARYSHLIEDMDFPNNFKALTYSVIPDLSQGELQLRDCARPDEPRQNENTTSTSHAAAVDIIGFADGPSVITLGRQASTQRKYIACSSWHFTPVPRVEWQMVFYIKENEDSYQEIVL